MPNPRDREHFYKFSKYVRHLKEEAERPMFMQSQYIAQNIWTIHDLARACVEEDYSTTLEVFSFVAKEMTEIPFKIEFYLNDSIDFNTEIKSFTASLPENELRDQRKRDTALCLDIFYLSGCLLQSIKSTPNKTIAPSDLIELKKLIIQLDTYFSLGVALAEGTQREKEASYQRAHRGGGKYSVKGAIRFLCDIIKQDCTGVSPQDCWNSIEKYTKDAPFVYPVNNTRLYLAEIKEKNQQCLCLEWVHRDKTKISTRTFKTFSNYYSNFYKKK